MFAYIANIMIYDNIMILILNNIIFIIHVAIYLVFRLVTVFPVLFVLALTDTWSNVANPCQHNPDQQLYYPHPHDAAKFIQCTKDGEMYIIQCPAGKEYNPSVTQCAHPVTTTVSISPNPPTLRPSKSFKKDASM